MDFTPIRVFVFREPIVFTFIAQMKNAWELNADTVIRNMGMRCGGGGILKVHFYHAALGFQSTVAQVHLSHAFYAFVF
jgi:hypothetical protein